MNEEELI